MNSFAAYGLALTWVMHERAGVWFQISPGVVSAVAPPTGAAGFARLFVVAALIVALATMILVAIAYDLSRKREAESVSLETRISRSLRGDPSLSPFPIVPTVRIPLWRGSPIIVAMTGSVPRSQLRHAALELALREAGRKARTYRVEDGILVDPTLARRAA